ncbi:hypothetical protein RUESEDTHA_01838 [Ruegeria sp. THAF57]|uniref:hypothetical protein n=1 Tax=Ruegeria sp. THAF57 TaxID=2744555 RepID=UPI0015DE9709|nr:hypothetical protein [Ruegeria sp. THAF57]CAD0184955.1 hypothetical protein RUESEDTHA_01838 [Ruegeria sp. THAF57]
MSSQDKEQLELNLTIVTEVENEGVGMGVLSNGAPYLTGRGLARLCGVSPSNVVSIVDDWQVEPPKKRVNKIKEIIREGAGDDTQAFITAQRSGSIHHAFPEHVCMAILEYYALDSATPNDHARSAYRTLARKGFTDFVYEQVGLPRNASTADLATVQYMDRVGLFENAVPMGYFSIFKEIAEMFASLVHQGVMIDSGFVPDISVGLAWAKYWKDENLQAVHGMRQSFKSSYPSYYPQSAAGPIDTYCYPDDALPEFRKWLRTVYYKEKLAPYLKSKVKSGSIAPVKATEIIDGFKPVALPKPN